MSVPLRDDPAVVPLAWFRQAIAKLVEMSPYEYELIYERWQDSWVIRVMPVSP